MLSVLGLLAWHWLSPAQENPLHSERAFCKLVVQRSHYQELNHCFVACLDLKSDEKTVTDVE